MICSAVIFMLTLSVMACGKEKGPTIIVNGDSVSSQQDKATEKSNTSTQTDDSTKNAESKHVNDRWIDVYKSFLRDKGNFNELLKDYWYTPYEAMDDTQREMFGFALLDVDGDEIPELFIEKLIRDTPYYGTAGYLADIYIYKYDGNTNSLIKVGSIETCEDNGSAYDDEFVKFYNENEGNGLFLEKDMLIPGYYPEDNTLVYTYSDGWSYIIFELNDKFEKVEKYRETCDVEPEYANFEQGSIVELEKFNSNYKPLWFYEITEENIENISDSYEKTFLEYTKEACIADFTDRLQMYKELWGE